MSFVAVPRPKRFLAVLQSLAAVAGGLALFLLSVAAVVWGFRVTHSGRILPGVSVAGVDLSNLTPDQATITLDQRLTYPQNGRIVFRYGSQVWTARPAELGLVIDMPGTIQRAYRLGRSGGLFPSLAGQLNSWQGGLDLAPVILFDERVAHGYLQNIGYQIGQPMVNADLHLSGADVYYTPGNVGRVLNVDATLAALTTQLESFSDGEIPLPVEEQTPIIQDASAEADILRGMLSAPLTITLPEAQEGDPGPWTLPPALLAGLLGVDQVQTDSGWQYQININAQPVELFLSQIAPQIDRAPQNARFYFDDYTRELVLVDKSISGRSLDISATRDAITQALLTGEHAVSLVLKVTQPEVTSSATASSLGITGLVSSYTSYFRGSSDARYQNIEAAARRIHGVLVPPNGTFSMADVLGDVSLENGYAEAPIIYNGRSIVGVGGGVCQVSTTLFRTAFEAGYPIVERHAHAYRVYYYEQTSSGLDSKYAGLDATVYVPLVDLKFTNDRPYWLLVEAYPSYSKHSLTFKFYSTDDGRQTEWENLGLRNVVPAPEPLFEENPDLPPETCKQVDWAADGADITVTRVVTRNGETLLTDAIKTHYEAWQAVYQFGPGTENPQQMAADGNCSH